jgi:two-component system, NtrC family, nitrogen regulation sensor histidine kinase NtrY
MKFRWLLTSLVIISSLLLYYGNKQTDYDAIIRKLEHSISHQLVEDSLTIGRYMQSSDDRAILHSLHLSPFFIEVFKNDTIIYWNNRTALTDNPANEIFDVLNFGDTSYQAFVKLNVNAFNSNEKSIGDKFSNVNLKPATDKVGDKKISIKGHVFNIEFEGNPGNQILKGWAWILLFVSFMLFSIRLIKNIKHNLSSGKDVKIDISIVIIGLILFRILHFLPAFTTLFDGFAGMKILNNESFIVQNICGLLINLWLFGIVIYLTNLLKPKNSKTTRYRHLLAFGTGFYTFFIFGTSVHILEGLVLSQEVNLEIEALLEFDAISFMLIICFSMLMILIFQSTQMLYEMMHGTALQGWSKYGLLISGWISAFALLWTMGWLNVPVWIFSLFIISYSLILDAYSEISEKKITYLIWWLIMFSGYLAVNLFYFGLKKDIAARTEFIHRYFSDPDDATVKAMQDLSDSLAAGDVFSRIASLDLPARLDMNDLYQFIFKNTQEENKYTIELFDKKTGSTLFNNHFADYYKLNQSYINSRKIGRNIVHNPFEDKYIIRFEIARTDAGNASWYLYITLQNNSAKSKSFKNNQPNFGFAVFNREKLIEKSEGNQVVPDLSVLRSINETCIKKDYSFVVSIPSDQYKIISWKKVSGLIKPISLFSFIFTLCGLILLCLSFINTRYNFLPENIALKFGSRSSLKTKIQLSIILLILFTFLIIGAITGFYFKNLIEANQRTKHKEETSGIINNIRSDIQNIDDDDSALKYLNSKLKDLSFVHNKELGLFDHSGTLVGSTSRELNAIRVPYSTWNASLNDTNRFAPPLDFERSDTEYVPMYIGDKRPFAFIGIDHKSYNSSGNILDFLSTILNAYIFLFLIAGAIAITIANSITQPLSILAEKLKKFKLGKSNDLLEWKSNDEIGTLIYDYNNLTQELERSAGLLAKTERDMAWREMAKQVAHEIKNPLTPMKLSIQYLERATKEYPEKAQALIPKISSTLIEQIDNLSQIANEFSNFATMPQASNEKLILNEIVETIHDLFRKRDDMDINMIEPIDDLYVFADKNHLVRILNNLLKNAIQAIPDNKRGKIEIELKRQGNEAIIRISDNGTGIPDHMKDKVFTPNFTTKSSGTGLGLAISSNMIESFNGRIYFETKVGFGTDFFVSIPLMRLDDYFGDESRVTLD